MEVGILYETISNLFMKLVQTCIFRSQGFSHINQGENEILNFLKVSIMMEKDAERKSNRKKKSQVHSANSTLKHTGLE